MKTLILYLSLAVGFSLSANAQNFKPDENFKSSYTNEPAYLLDTVVQSPYTKLQLYSNVLAFLNNSFKDSRNVVEMKDADLGEVAFKGNVVKTIQKTLTDKKGKKSTYSENVRLFFKCKSYVKDNKFKIVLSALEYPFSEILSTDVRMSVSVINESENNTAAQELARAFLNDMITQLNKKPENDF